jgi:hypothetical protein
MNKYRTARLVSDELVVTEAEKNQTSVNLIPAFASGIAKLKSNNIEIRATMVLQGESNTGITDEKGITHVELIDCMIDVEGGVHAYAKAKGDSVLLAKVSHTSSHYGNMAFSVLIDIAKSILQLAKAIPTVDLSQYGISTSEITELETTLQKFTTIKSSPKEAKIEHSGYTQKIVNLQTDSQFILSLLDKMAIQFKKKAPEYYAIYKTSRNVLTVSPHKKRNDIAPTPPVAK